MFGGQHRIDEAETARASWGDTSEKQYGHSDAIRVSRDRCEGARKKHEQNLLKRSASLEITHLPDAWFLPQIVATEAC